MSLWSCTAPVCVWGAGENEEPLERRAEAGAGLTGQGVPCRRQDRIDTAAVGHFGGGVGRVTGARFGRCLRAGRRLRNCAPARQLVAAVHIWTASLIRRGAE